MKKKVNKKVSEKTEIKKSSILTKTETFLSLQRELILKEEKRQKEIKSSDKNIIKDIAREKKYLKRELKKHENDNIKTYKKIEQLKKQVYNDKRLNKTTIKIKLNQIKQLEELQNIEGIYNKPVIIGKNKYFKFNISADKDEIKRVDGKNFNYYINDIFGNILKIKNSEITKDNFNDKVLKFIEKGLREEEKNLKLLIKKYKKLKDERKVKGLSGSLYGIEKQLEKIYANDDALEIEDEIEREEFINSEEASPETEAPIMINRRNNIIQILG